MGPDGGLATWRSLVTLNEQVHGVGEVGSVIRAGSGGGRSVPGAHCLGFFVWRL